jgi:hypothetical protein
LPPCLQVVDRACMSSWWVKVTQWTTMAAMFGECHAPCQHVSRWLIDHTCLLMGRGQTVDHHGCHVWSVSCSLPPCLQMVDRPYMSLDG